MFRRILLAWPNAAQPARLLEVARSLADAYGAELTVCVLGNGTVEALPDVRIERLPGPGGERELLRYAHDHAFDLLVVPRAGRADPLPRRVIDGAAVPVLVVAEGAAA